MKKSLILIFIGLLFASYGMSQEVKWYSWNEGYKKAKSENKIVLIDVYTDWCHWCKVMDKKTYTNASIIKKIEKNYIPIKINPEKDTKLNFEGKIYTGKALVDKLSNNSIEGYPTTLFYFPKTKKTQMVVGYKSAEQMLPILENYTSQK